MQKLRTLATALAGSVALIIAAGQQAAQADGLAPVDGSTGAQTVRAGDSAQIMSPRIAQDPIDFANQTYVDNTGTSRGLLPCTDYSEPLSHDLSGLPAGTSQAELDDMGYASADPAAAGALFASATTAVAVQECMDKASPGAGTLSAGTDGVAADQVTFSPFVATSQALGPNAPASLPDDATPVVASGRLYTARSSASGGAGPTYFDNVNPNAIYRGDTQATFGFGNDGSNGIMSDFAYDTKTRDRRGRLIVMFNAIDVSIGTRTNLYTARASTREYGGPRTIFPGAGASSPINSQTTENTAGYTVSLSATGSGQYGGFTAGVSKEFGQSYSTVDGFNYVDPNNNNHIYQHDGGYRQIATNHHNESRSFNEAAAWIYPPGVSQQWQFSFNVSYKKR